MILRPLRIAFLLLAASFALPARPVHGQAVRISTDPNWASGPTNSTTSMAWGDIDRDGYLDLVCGNSDQPNVVYFSDRGFLRTSPGWESDLSRPTSCVALADLDGDGDLDLVCGNGDEPSTIYRNENGTLETSPSWEAPARGTRAVQAGDLDRDGDLDLVFAAYYGSSPVYLNEAGDFPDTSAFALGGFYSTDVALVDVDADGWLDIVFSGGLTNRLYMNLNGMFDPAPAWEVDAGDWSSYCVVPGDLNGDGRLDLFFGTGEHDRNRVYLNTGGTYAIVPDWTTPDSVTCGDAALGDLDGDGDLDLAATFIRNAEAGTRIYVNQGGVLADSAVVILPWGSDVILGDMGNDGTLDVALGRRGQNTIHDTEGDFLSTAVAWQSDGSDSTVAVALGDVDGDGDLDLVCAVDRNRNVAYLNSGGTFSGQPDWRSETNIFTRDVGLADVDRDGRLDAVFVNQLDGNEIYYGTASGFETTPRYTWDDSSHSYGVALGDVDRDGRVDAVCARARDVALFLGTDTGLADTAAWTSSRSTGFKGVALGDADGDGDLDLSVLPSSCCGAIYLNEGGRFADDPVFEFGSNSTGDVAMGDLDGDGRDDVAVASVVDGDIAYRSDGAASSRLFFQGGIHWDVEIADLDGDGFLDLVYGGDRTTVYLNGGRIVDASVDWEWPPFPTPLRPTRGIAVGDVNEDGLMDVVLGNLGEPDALHLGLRAAAYRHDPEAPVHQLPNNGAFLRDVRIGGSGPGPAGDSLAFRAIDIESDPVWLLVEYQRSGEPLWNRFPALGVNGLIGPFASSPEGSIHEIALPFVHLPLGGYPVTLRFSALSPPRSAGTIQTVPTYVKDIGFIEIDRPEISLSPAAVDFPTLTVGSDTSLVVEVANVGNRPLIVQDIVLPSGEMAVSPAPPISIPEGESRGLTLALEPRSGTEITGEVRLLSNDPIRSPSRIPVTTDIRDLEGDLELLSQEDPVPLGQAVTVLLVPRPGVVFDEAHLVHRVGGETVFSDSIRFTPAQSGFVAVVPGEYVTEAGLDYFVRMTNGPVSRTNPPGAPQFHHHQAVTVPAGMIVTAHPNSGNDYLEDRDVEIEVAVPPGTVVEGGKVFHRRGGEGDFSSGDLAFSAGVGRLTLSGGLFGERGLEYYVEVRTRTSLLRTPAAAGVSFLPVKVLDLAEAADSPGGTYRMVSVPLDFGPDFSGTLEALLSDQQEFGAYRTSQWRSFRWRPDAGSYAELPEPGFADEFTVLPGRAFWLICRDPHRIRTSPRDGFSVSTISPFAIVLEEGWNQVGNPFSFPVTWSTVTFSVPDSLVEGPYRRDSGDYSLADTLRPFEGYWVRSWAGGPVTVEVHPLEAGMPSGPGGIQGEAEDGGEWEVSIVASAGDLAARSRAGMSGAARNGWDVRDMSLVPPPPGRSLSVYFPHDDWGRRSGRFRSDVRTRGNQVWVFDVAGSHADLGSGDAISLEVSGTQGVPEPVRLVLVDRVLGRAVDLREGSAYTFHSGVRRPRPQDEARFRLVAGDEAFVESVLSAFPPPSRFFLHQNYPNPFRGAAVIRYEIASREDVTLEVFDIQGRRVKTLARGPQDPGRYEVVWGGDSDAGARAAPGLYFYRLSAGPDSRIRKLVKLD